MTIFDPAFGMKHILLETLFSTNAPAQVIGWLFHPVVPAGCSVPRVWRRARDFFVFAVIVPTSMCWLAAVHCSSASSYPKSHCPHRTIAATFLALPSDRYQVRHWGSNLKDGDVLLSNHPQLAGGRCGNQCLEQNRIAPRLRNSSVFSP